MRPARRERGWVLIWSLDGDCCDRDCARREWVEVFFVGVGVMFRCGGGLREDLDHK